MKFRYWLPTLIWASLIFFLSSLPTVQASSIQLKDFLIKKTAHFIEYFILAWLFHRSLKHSTELRLGSRLALTMVATILYAASDEFHQSFVAGRGPSVRDVVIDSTGVLSACLAIFHSHPKS